MKKIAFLFPGQGAQYPGMGKDFYTHFSIAKELFQEADELLEENISKVIFEGPESLLTQTFYSQLGIFIVSAALFKVLQKEMPDLLPSISAGLSLGEYTALFAAGSLSFKETLFLVRQRARLMTEACEKNQGAMAAVLGLEEDKVEEAIVGLSGVWIANYNTPGQIVISGTKEGVEKGSLSLKEKGAKRIIPLAVQGAFHSGLMGSAQEGLTPFIHAANIQEGASSIVMNVPGDFVQGVEAIKKNLILQVTHSVKWHQGILQMESKGVDLYLEIGCSKTLSAMNRKIGVKGAVASLEKLADLEEVSLKTENVMRV